MNKEVLEKVNEILKSNGRQALSLDEADKVAGGMVEYNPATGMGVIDGQEVEVAAFNKYFMDAAKVFGLESAISGFQSVTGWSCSDMGSDCTGLKGAEAASKMSAILNQFWASLGA